MFVSSPRDQKETKCSNALGVTESTLRGPRGFEKNISGRFTVIEQQFNADFFKQQSFVISIDRYVVTTQI